MVKFIFLAGLLVALLPMLGFPRSAESLIQVAAGLSLLISALRLRSRFKRTTNAVTDVYVDSRISRAYTPPHGQASATSRET